MTDATKLIETAKAQQFIAEHDLRIASVRTQPFLGSDIEWSKTDEGWEILLYPALYYDGPANGLVLMALADIAHRTVPIYAETPADEFNSRTAAYLASGQRTNAQSERVAAELVRIDRALGCVIEVYDLAVEGYVTLAEVRNILSFQSGRIVSSADSVSYLGLVAALRQCGGDCSLFTDTVLSRRLYELLPIVDRIEACLQLRRAVHKDVVEVFEMMATAHAESTDAIAKVRLLKELTLGPRDSKALEYDVALSFAGEDRTLAEQIASALSTRGYRVFYDKYVEAEVWGKDLYSHLTDVYQRRARYCVLFISEHYVRKQWTNHERRAAQARAFEDSREYILPLRLDDTDAEGVLPTVGYVDGRTHTVDEIVRLLVDKLEGS